MISKNHNNLLSQLCSFFYDLRARFNNYIYMMLINSFIVVLVASYYISYQQDYNFKQIIFLISMHISYMLTLSLSISIMCLPVIILPSKIMRAVLPMIISLLLLFLITDILVYDVAKAHIKPDNFMHMLGNLEFSKIELLFASLFAIVVIFAEYKLFSYKEHLPVISDKPHKYYWFVIIYALSLAGAYASFSFVSYPEQQYLLTITEYCDFFE